MGLWSWMRGWLGRPESKPLVPGEKPLIALVLFLTEPRDLDSEIIARQAGRALGRSIPCGECDTSESFVAGEEPSFVLKHGDFVFLINTFPRPYMDDPDAAASGIGELRLRKAVRDHNAWISVDLLGDVDRSQLPEVYRIIGKLAAGLADDDCLAVFAPATGQLSLYDSGTRHMLRGERPLELFETSHHPPVVPVCGDDPRLKAAVAKAKKRWSEFVTAFEERRDEQTFAVKARIGNGEVFEFMWVAVSGLENGWIYGKLDNDPIELTTIHCGDRVRVHVKDLNDWLYTAGEQVHGGFTIEVLRKIQEEM